MADIIRIAIKGEAGYGPADMGYRDKVTLEHNSIRYEYKPMIESENNVSRRWTYKTTSPVFQKLFKEVADAVDIILGREEIPFCTDIGATTFTIAYADKTKRERYFFLPGDEFKECFDVIKQMIPGCEDMPNVLMTSEDHPGICWAETADVTNR